MKIEPTLRIQYLKGCRTAMKRGPHPSDADWLADALQQIRAIARFDVRQEAETKFQQITARRRFLNPGSAEYANEVLHAFDVLIEYLEKNDITRK